MNGVLCLFEASVYDANRAAALYGRPFCQLALAALRREVIDG